MYEPENEMERIVVYTEWPLLKGWMSRKASVFSDSKSLKQGISPEPDVSVH